MNKADIYKKISNNIKRIRKSKGLTQEAFAEIMDVSWTYVAKIESGKYNISIGKIVELANYLKTDIKELLKL